MGVVQKVISQTNDSNPLPILAQNSNGPISRGQECSLFQYQTRRLRKMSKIEYLHEVVFTH